MRFKQFTYVAAVIQQPLHIATPLHVARCFPFRLIVISVLDLRDGLKRVKCDSRVVGPGSLESCYVAALRDIVKTHAATSQ